jgi:Ca-activated chloride channel family protein
MRDPGLLEYVGRDLFRARVFPIPARGDVQVKIVYEEVLEYDAGLVEYRHPLQVDGKRNKAIGQLSMAVSVRSSSPVKTVYSPTHDIDADIDGHTAKCGFEMEDVVPDRDFVMYYSVSTDDVGLNLLTYRKGEDDGYFMMLLSPGRLADPSKVIAKDVVFVLDKSGSMKGEKIEQAKGALAYCIESLNRSDRFNIVLFSTNVNTYSDDLVRATRREKDRAREFVDEITARGGTDINNALLAALEPPASARPRMVIFLTDGLPTVGETNVQAILSSLRKRGDDVRIFPFGVGYDVNTDLLDQLGVEHHGAVDYIRPEEDIEDKVSRFYDKVSNPVLSDVSVNVSGVELLDVYPNRLPDIFDGTQMVVLGRYTGSGSESITLTGDVGGRERTFDYEGTFERRSDEYGFIPRIWANRKIAYLLSEIKLHGDRAVPGARHHHPVHLLPHPRGGNRRRPGNLEPRPARAAPRRTSVDPPSRGTNGGNGNFVGDGAVSREKGHRRGVRRGQQGPGRGTGKSKPGEAGRGRRRALRRRKTVRPQGGLLGGRGLPRRHGID